MSHLLNRYTIKNLLMNRKRTIVTMIGIILSCSLICGVTTLVSSFQGSMLEYAKEEAGNYHAHIRDITKQEKEAIQEDKNTKQIIYEKVVGYAKLEGSQNKYKPYLFIEELDDAGFSQLPIELTEGRLPQNNREIVISNHILTNGQVKLQVGDMLSLQVGTRESDGTELIQSNPYLEEEEQFHVKEERNYTIVGIVERSSLEDYSAPGYTVFSRLESTKEANNLYVLLKEPKKSFEISENFHIDKSQISYNSEVLRFEGASQNRGVDATLYTLSAIIIGIIMFASISVIRNSFTISVTERIRQYGMLSSIGATSKQIKRNVLFEGMILGAIAIPLGIGAGILGIWITLGVINGIIADFMDGFFLQLSVSWASIGIAFLFAAITIFLSAIFPARKAAKISPMDAIRSTNDIKIHAKKLHTPKLFTKFFGIEGDIALKNLKRSKKKYRTTIFSIFVSITIFIAFSSFIEYGFKIGNAYYGSVDYNIVIHGGSNTDYEKIAKLDDIKKYSVIKDLGMEIPSEYLTSEISSSQNGASYCLKFISLDQKTYQNYIKSIGGKVEEYQDKAIIIDKNLRYMDGKMHEYRATSLKKGDAISLEDGFEVPIATITEKVPLGEEEQLSYTILAIISEQKFEQLCQMEEIEDIAGTMYIDSSNSTKLEEKIEKLNKELSENVYNLEESTKYQNSIILVISIFLYGFITIISLIGVTNIFNTITTNMSLRSKEFAILKSIGMTNKEFRKMIHLESIFYGVKSLFYGIPFGIVLSYFIYEAIGNMYQTTYVPPYTAILISIIFVFAIIFMTMTYSMAKTKKQNVIETIRKENI